MRRLFLSFLVLSAFSLAPLAKADSITLTLLSPTETVSGASTLYHYSATAAALSTNTGREYLNGDSFHVTSPATLADVSFFNDFPFFLTPGQSFTGALFTVTIPTVDAGSLFPGSFTLLGGATGSSSNALATVAFSAGGATTLTPTPEPSSLALLGTGLVGVVGAMRRRFGA